MVFADPTAAADIAFVVTHLSPRHGDHDFHRTAFSRDFICCVMYFGWRRFAIEHDIGNDNLAVVEMKCNRDADLAVEHGHRLLTTESRVQ